MTGITTDSNSECLRKIEPSGMQKCYLVLSEEERAKGFVRPVRQNYRHVKCGSITTMGLAIAETYARNPKFYGGTFCCNCGTHFPLHKTITIKDEMTGKEIETTQPQFLWDDGSAVGS